MNKKKIFWAIVSLLIAGFTIWAVASQNQNFSIENFILFVKKSQKAWIIGAGLCMFGFIAFEGLAIVRILNSLGYKRRFHSGLVYGGADVYFSAITPSASGGQPASAFFMMRDGIPGPVVTVTLLTNLIMYTLALLSVGLLCIIFRFDLFMSFSVISKVFIAIGVVVLLLLAFAFLLLLKKAEILYGICDKCLAFFEKIHLLKNADKKREKLHATMADYQECAKVVHGKKEMLIEAYLWNLLQRLSQFGVSFMVFMAQGMGWKKAFEVFLSQCYVSLGSNCVPIPGSMGVADYLMLDAYMNVIGKECAANMELLSRSISFYGCIVTSGVIVLLSLLIYKIRGKKC